MKTYCDYGINWNWYLDVELHGDEVTILRHYRLHKYLDGIIPHLETCGSFHLVEATRKPFSNEPRLVVAVDLFTGSEGRKTYKVTNPKGPFDYR